MKYFIDTNIISYLLKGNLSVKKRIQDIIMNDDEISIPSIVFYEVKRGLLASSSELKSSVFSKFVEHFGITDLTTSTLESAAQVYADLKKQGQLIEDDDLFIGCSALDNNAILLTNNERHLKRIKNLQIEVLN